MCGRGGAEERGDGVKYGAILCDPPWAFKTYSEKGKGRSAERHYDVMDFDDMCHRWGILSDYQADDCCLFLWTTDPMLPKALELMGRWGFTYKTVAFTWVKVSRRDKFRTMYPISRPNDWFTGMGYWTRSNPEMCLLGTRGKPKRIHKDVRQLIVASRREHSRKPDCIYERIERLVEGPYLEMFARQQRPGWDSWGNETTKFEAAE
jgi:N6-adenosine-specific RNA methylase IME4